MDLGPTAGKQLDESRKALQATDGSLGRRWAGLVCTKVLGEVLGLSLALRASSPVCAAAVVILGSHLLFWLGGAASARVDAAGRPAPLPPPVVKVIFGADLVACSAAALGWLGPTQLTRAVGSATYGLGMSIVCWEKLSGKMAAQRRKVTPGSGGAVAARAVRVARHAVAEAERQATQEESEAADGADEWKGFDWKRQWYPLAFVKTTDKDVPHRLELFGEHLVFWWDSLAWRAMLDECPHRLAPLSEGRIDEAGCIECPYHGWAFEGSSGACTRIPQLEGMGNSDVRGKCGGTVFRIVERQGLVWVWGERGLSANQADEGLIPVCEAMEDPAFDWIDVSRDMPYSADMLIENVIDSSHVHFTHHKTISKRENAKPLPLRVTTKITPSGFEGTFQPNAEVAPTGEGATNVKKTERSTKYMAPGYMHHRIRSTGDDGSFDTGFETWTVAYATPSGPGRCRLFARFPFRFPKPKRGPNFSRFIIQRLPDWLQHLGQLRVLDDDNIFLPMQERRVQDVGGWRRYIMPATSDNFVKAYRRWYDRAGDVPHAACAVDEHRAKAPSKEELLDRKAQHTAHCRSCSGALRSAERLQQVCRLALFLGFAVMPTLLFRMAVRPTIALVAALLAIAKVWQLAASIETGLTSGLASYPPPRNQKAGRGKGRELRTVEQGRRF